MANCKLTAILRKSQLHLVESGLHEIGVCNVTVSSIHSGEYSSPGREEWVIFHVKLEVITTLSQTSEIKKAILRFARTGKSGDGLIYIEEIDEAIRIRDGREVLSDRHDETEIQ